MFVVLLLGLKYGNIIIKEGETQHRQPNHADTARGRSSQLLGLNVLKSVLKIEKQLSGTTSVLNQIGLIIKGDTSYIMGVSSGLLSLQNDKFMERQIEFYKKVQEEKDMIDVTVACDGAEVKAHRLVISASSPFFRKIIKTSNHPSPYIYLSGLHPDDLESIMSFVYTGETKVEANNIQRFMNSASELQISGLCEDPVEALGTVETDLAEGESPTVDTKVE